MSKSAPLNVEEDLPPFQVNFGPVNPMSISPFSKIQFVKVTHLPRSNFLVFETSSNLVTESKSPTIS